MWNLAVSRAGNNLLILHVLENPADADRMGWDRIDRSAWNSDEISKILFSKTGWGTGGGIGSRA